MNSLYDEYVCFRFACQNIKKQKIDYVEKGKAAWKKILKKKLSPF